MEDFNAVDSRQSEDECLPLIIKHIYYVDFENTRALGLTGYSDLTSVDKVVILYTKFISDDELSEIESVMRESRVEIIAQETPAGDEMLDKCLLMRLGADVGAYGDAYKYHVVARDDGYITACNWFRKHYKVDVQIQDRIGNAYSELLHRKDVPDSVLDEVQEKSLAILKRVLKRHEFPYETIERIQRDYLNEFADQYRVRRSVNVALSRAMAPSVLKSVYRSVKKELDYLDELVDKNSTISRTFRKSVPRARKPRSRKKTRNQASRLIYDELLDKRSDFIISETQKEYWRIVDAGTDTIVAAHLALDSVAGINAVSEPTLFAEIDAKLRALIEMG